MYTFSAWDVFPLRSFRLWTINCYWFASSTRDRIALHDPLTLGLSVWVALLMGCWRTQHKFCGILVWWHLFSHALIVIRGLSPMDLYVQKGWLSRVKRSGFPVDAKAIQVQNKSALRHLPASISYFFIAVTKYPMNTMSRIYFGSQFEGLESAMVGEGMVWGIWSLWSHSISSQKAER